MAKTATASVTIAVSGDGVSFKFTTPTQTNAASPFQHQPIALTTGANTITPPAGATMALVVPPTSSAVTKTLKGVTGDTGYALNPPGMPSFIPVGAGALVINASSGETVEFYWL